MSRTMAEVLAEQLCGWNEDAPCGDCLDDAERYVAALSAAGFGLVADAKAGAWDEGFDRGFYDPLAASDKDASESLATNPYRAVS